MRQTQITLIDQSITNLRTLADAFSQGLYGRDRSDLASRKSKEALLTISVLLPKLQEVREVFNIDPPIPKVCERCED